MEKLFLFVLSQLVLTFQPTPTTYTVSHKRYTSTFNVSTRYPVLVEWWLTTKMVTCSKRVEREDAFKVDPRLQKHTALEESYVNSGYDRGHMFPAKDGSCDIVSMRESFYYSNVTPQTPQLNRGDWKTVEELTRLEASRYDSIHVWAGSVGSITKIGVVTVPKQCWKVIYVKKTGEWFAYLFSNDNAPPNGIKDNITTVANISKLTGFTFK